MSLRKTVLIIDENRTVAQYVGDVLKKMGFGVETAGTGREALRMVGQKRPDLVLCQAVMSDLSGADTLKAIRREPGCGKLPVVMMSANADDRVIERCKSAGASGFLSMPLRMDELHNVLQECVLSISGFKRRHMRVNAKVKVMLAIGGISGMFTTEMLSEGGMYICANKPPPVLTELSVSIPAPDRNLKLKGLVIYHGGNGGGNGAIPQGMAIEFVGMDDDEAASLRLLVNKLVTGET